MELIELNCGTAPVISEVILLKIKDGDCVFLKICVHREYIPF